MVHARLVAAVLWRAADLVAGGCGQGAAAQFAHHQGCDVDPGGAGESKAPVAWSAVAAIEQAALDLLPTDWDAALDAVDRALYAVAWALATRGALPTALPPHGFDERLAAIFAWSDGRDQTAGEVAPILRVAAQAQTTNVMYALPSLGGAAHRPRHSA